MEEQKKGGGCPGPTRGFDPMTFIYEIYPYRISKMYLPGASLGWVTPGAATEGNRPSIFSWKTWRPFFAHRCHYHYRFLLLSCGCHPPPPRVSPHTFFYLSDLVSPLFFVNLPTISPPIVTPLESSTPKLSKVTLPTHMNVVTTMHCGQLRYTTTQRRTVPLIFPVIRQTISDGDVYTTQNLTSVRWQICNPAIAGFFIGEPSTNT